MAQLPEIAELELAFELAHKETRVPLYRLLSEYLVKPDNIFFERIIARLNFIIINSDIDKITRLLEPLIKKESDKLTDIEHVILGIYYLTINNNCGQYEFKSIKHFIAASNLGNVPALHFLGLIYYPDIKNNKALIEKVINYWQVAAEKQFVSSLVCLARLFINSSEQKEPALKYYQIAAHQGCDEAQLALGCYYFTCGHYSLAQTYLLSAVKKGNITALFKLHELYMKGLCGLDSNYLTAKLGYLILEKVPIAQEHILKKIELFINNVTYIKNGQIKFEIMPEEVRKGLCSGFVFMLFRSALINEEEVYLSRLRVLMLSSDDNLKADAKLFSDYRIQFEKVAAENNNLLLQKLLQNLGDKKQIKTEHYHYIREKVIARLNLDDNRRGHFVRAENLYVFISSLMFAHYPHKVELNLDDKFIMPHDFDFILNVIPPDKFLQQNIAVTNVFKFSFVLTDQEWISTFKKIVLPGDFVISSTIRHKMFILCNKRGYLFYDPNGDYLVRSNTCEELISEIQYCLYKIGNINDEIMALSLSIKRLNQHSTVRPSVKQLIDEIFQSRGGTQSNINLATSAGETSLLIAAANGQEEIVHELLLRKANPDICLVSGSSAIFFAAQNGHDKVVDSLAKNGAELYKETNDKNVNYAPAVIASKFGHYLVLQVLAQHDVNFERYNLRGLNLLTIALYHNHTEAVKVILSRHPNMISKPDDGDRTAIGVAHWNKNLTMIVEMLIVVKSQLLIIERDKKILKEIRSELVDHFLKFLNSKQNNQEKIGIIDSVINQQNALGQFFHTPQYPALFLFSTASETDCIQRIQAFRRQLSSKINSIDTSQQVPIAKPLLQRS